MRTRSAALLFALLLPGCRAPSAGVTTTSPAATATAGPTRAVSAAPQDWAPPLELVESVPVETALDDPGMPEAATVWLEMIGQARSRLDIAQFYLSNAAGSALEPIVAAIEEASRRGVAVRLLVEQRLIGQYPETVERLETFPGIVVRRFDLSARMGGILHAKYFVVDDRDAFLGSQNFDWRALTHIHELGLRIREPELVRQLSELFELDWALAGGARPSPSTAAWSPMRVRARSEMWTVQLVASPKGWLPDESAWDLPAIVKRIDGARRAVRIQLLSYEPTMRDGSTFTELDDALRRAAARGVSVELLVADWCKRAGTIEPLQRLARVAGIEVRLVTIPPFSGGFIPFARVIHAKYLLVDDASAWLGTSNWSGDYFLRSRNAGIVVDGAGFAARLETVFRRVWSSPYAQRLDPDAPVILGVR